MADSRQSFIWAIKQQESGGDYNVVNSSSGALGAYQVMPSNIADWTRQALGQSISPQQYLSDPIAQDRVAETILGGYYDQYGARGAAAMWYSGQPDPNKTFGNPSVADYVNQVINRMNSSPPVSGSTSVQTGATVNRADDLANGLAQGIQVSAKSILGPTLKWTGWVLITGAGLVLVTLGAVLIIQQSKPVQEAKKAVEGFVGAKTGGAVSKGTAVKKAAAPKAASKQFKQPRGPVSEKVEFQTEEQATAQKSFGAAHPSYGPPPTVTRKPVKGRRRTRRPVKKVSRG